MDATAEGAQDARNGAQNGRDSRQIAYAVLAQLELFRGVAPARIAAVASLSHTLSLRRGAALCVRGALLPGVIALAYGSAKVSLRGADDEERVVRFIGPGESFGEAAALHDRVCPVEVIALADSLAVVMPPLSLLHLLENNPRFARNLARLLSERFFALLGDLQESVQKSALQRLAGYMTALAQGPGAMVRLPASKTSVASRLDISKETLSRLLRQLAERGLIVVGRREIEVLDRAALAGLAR